MMIKGEQHRAQIESVEEVAINHMAPSDGLLIVTENHVYSFTVSNPAATEGVLSGGFLGDKAVKATLMASPSDSDAARFNFSKLVAGNRVVFFIESKQGLVSGVTSAVKKFIRISRRAARKLQTAY